MTDKPSPSTLQSPGALSGVYEPPACDSPGKEPRRRRRGTRSVSGQEPHSRGELDRIPGICPAEEYVRPGVEGLVADRPRRPKSGTECQAKRGAGKR